MPTRHNSIHPLCVPTRTNVTRNGKTKPMMWMKATYWNGAEMPSKQNLRHCLLSITQKNADLIKMPKDHQNRRRPQRALTIPDCFKTKLKSSIYNMPDCLRNNTLKILDYANGACLPEENNTKLRAIHAIKPDFDRRCGRKILSDAIICKSQLCTHGALCCSCHFTNQLILPRWQVQFDSNWATTVRVRVAYLSLSVEVKVSLRVSEESRFYFILFL